MLPHCCDPDVCYHIYVYQNEVPESVSISALVLTEAPPGSENLGGCQDFIDLFSSCFELDPEAHWGVEG